MTHTTKLSPAQREVLEAVGRNADEVYRDAGPPYTSYLQIEGDRDRAVSGSTDVLLRRDLIRLGRRVRFVRYFELTDAGREELARLQQAAQLYLARLTDPEGKTP